MRIALAWNHPSALRHCSFRFDRYLLGFSRLGHEPILVAQESALTDTAVKAIACTDLAAFKRPAFWHEQVAADVVVLVTWHQMPDVLRAIKEGGSATVAIADSDGMFSDLVYPQNMALRRQSCGDSLAQPIDPIIIESTHHSDRVIFGHAEGARHFAEILRFHGCPRLIDRLHVAPFAIGKAFHQGPPPESKDDLIVAVGRWDAFQKNATALMGAMERFHRHRPQTRFELFGSDENSVLAGLERKNVAVRGPVTPPLLAKSLRRARAIVFSSHYEGSPHAALEALALGASVVGPPLPFVVDWSASGQDGTVATSGSPNALSDAMLREMDQWDRGHREPADRSRRWRFALRPGRIARSLLGQWAA